MSSQSNNVIDFALHTLGWKAFQDLSVAIMGEIFGHEVQAFYDSNDGGRDGAFRGKWTDKKGNEHMGAFTAQCKFTSYYNDGIKLVDVKDELEKAKRLAEKGLCDHYVLFTNAKLTGNQAEKLKEAFESINGIKSFVAYGKDRISQIISESPRLRMLVPRLYGLGDLSQILDERAGQQAQAILYSLGDDISKFVLTKAYNRSAKALVEHGFVLLLGEPACGKSTIAAALALGALDEWGCNSFKLCSSEEFIKHWNPNEPKRLFWIDDAFGATQVDWGATFSWNSAFSHINAAIHHGAKVIFTSRDYIYKAAKRYLKETAIPVLRASQVVIDVQDISLSEKKQILYNHIKLGNQNEVYKRNIKPYLDGVAINNNFTPEIARRLGNSFFTNSLRIDSQSLQQFVERPVPFLIDILSTIDKQSLSALALIFMRAGALDSPIQLNDSESNALSLLGGTLDGVINSLNDLKDSLTIKSYEDDNYVWKYKHPTIRDAFAQYLANNSELMEIYLAGAPVTKLLKEVACTNKEIQGVKIVIPSSQYLTLINRINSFDRSHYQDKWLFNGFITRRCSRKFLSEYLSQTPNLFNDLRVTRPSFFADDLQIFVKYFEEGLLPERYRLHVVKKLSEFAISDQDVQFSERQTSKLFSLEEINKIKEDIAEKVIPNLESILENISSNFDEESDPEEHFSDLEKALTKYEEIFDYEDNKHLFEHIYNVKELVKEEIIELKERRTAPNEDEYYGNSHSINPDESRSIFDDIDS